MPEPNAPTAGLDVSQIVGLLQTGAAVGHEDHLLVRGLPRWLVVDGRRWALADSPQVRIDARTVDALRQATCGDGLVYLHGQPWVLAEVEEAGSRWARLTIGGPIDPDVGGPVDPVPPGDAFRL